MGSEKAPRSFAKDPLHLSDLMEFMYENSCLFSRCEANDEDTLIIVPNMTYMKNKVIAWIT